MYGRETKEDEAQQADPLTDEASVLKDDTPAQLGTGNNDLELEASDSEDGENSDDDAEQAASMNAIAEGVERSASSEMRTLRRYSRPSMSRPSLAKTERQASVDLEDIVII